MSSNGPAALEAKVAAAVEVWTGELIDLGGRNTLLYYKDLKSGTVSLDEADEVAVESLLGSQTVRLSNLFGDDLGPLARRARTVRAKAAENFEERGLQTLFLAWGMATWTNLRGTATPAAPILLCQANLAPRGGAGEDFDLTLTGEWEVNPTLLHLLSTDHDVRVDDSALLNLLDLDLDAPDATPVFARLCKEASSVAGFGVTPRVVLGNFSYAKLPMVKDLETATEVLAASALVAAIAGDESARDVLRSRHPEGLNESAPDHTPPADEFLVRDADASQSYVINAAVSGADVVCIGPPGTGKSQTIANLIATFSARGKTVLFVAEKRAAIDAVLERLEKVSLSDLVMDLHDGPGSRRVLAQKLSRALAAASQVPLPNMAAEQDALVRRRDDLRTGMEALHTKREPWGLTIYDVQAEVLGIPESVHSTQRLPREVLSRLHGDQMRDASSDLETYAGLGGLDIWSTQSPWLPALGAGTITNADQASAALEAATNLSSHTLPQAAVTLRALLAEVGLVEPRNLAEWASALELLAGVASTLAVFTPEVYDLDLAALATQLEPGNRSAIARLGSEYRGARKALKGLELGPLPKGTALHAAVVTAAAQAAKWARASADGRRPRLPSDLTTAKATLGQLAAEIRALEAYAQINLEIVSIDDLAAALSGLLGDRATLYRLPELYRLNSALERRGLGPLTVEMRNRQFSVAQALECLRYVWLSSILESVSIADTRIGAFDGPARSRTVAEFRAADSRHIETAPTRIKRAVAEHITAARDAYPKESELVAAQAARKTRHMPVRQLFQAAPHVLGAVKPCWAMSPLVVAQLLPAQRCFDVVIFDEASQVTPADAIGALMRADQVIVAGDPHQLPPSAFFVTNSDGGDGDGDAEGDGEDISTALTSNIESVLDVMSALLPAPFGTRTLTWHYRSRDERLIAFSNAQAILYDWSLVTFPGTAGGDMPIHHLVSQATGFGGEGSGDAEVVKVVELVAEHAHSRPDESLGVITMGIKHADRISEMLRKARQADPELDDFMSETAKERFFVKNLERVQGDERDAIILSIGYGKLADGRMSYRFGPVNQQGGERRLNVAVTRARSRMTVVSAFSSLDMDPNRLKAEGAKMLMRYLAYSESGGNDLGPNVKEHPALNPFEIDVRDKLTAAGIPLVAQYGVSGYWIDFVAQHPQEPGRMVLAIESDGASYHSSFTARDRDRLRQQHLENLGWTFHRIWSTEWFHRHEAEIERAKEAYARAVERTDNPQSVPGGTSKGPGAMAVSEIPPPAAPIPQRSGPQPIHGGRANIMEYSPAELVTLIRWIQSDTLLRTEDQLLTEAMRCLSMQKRGSRIVAEITAAIERAKQPGLPSPRLKASSARKSTSVRKVSTYRSRPSRLRPRRRW